MTKPAVTCEAAVNLHADGQCKGHHTIVSGATDNCDTTLPITQSPAGTVWSLGTTSVTHGTTDDSGNANTCATTVKVTDNTAPTIACNLSAITPPSAPITFTATAADNCSVSSVLVTSYDCWKINGAGKKIDKKGSCVVSYTGAGLTITDVGGVGTTIEWTVVAKDGSGNTYSKLCSTTVQHPGNGNGGSGGNGSGCNQGVGNGDEGCDPGNSGKNGSNDENGGTPGNPGKGKGKGKK